MNIDGFRDCFVLIALFGLESQPNNLRNQTKFSSSLKIIIDETLNKNNIKLRNIFCSLTNSSLQKETIQAFGFNIIAKYYIDIDGYVAVFA